MGLNVAQELIQSDETKDQGYAVRHRLSPRQVEMVRAGGRIPLVGGRPST